MAAQWSYAMQVFWAEAGTTFDTQIRVSLRTAMEEEAEHMLNLFKLGYASWSTSSHPTWEQDLTQSGRHMFLELSTLSKPFVWVMEGTDKRWAIMHHTYKPKSRAGKLGAAGSGGRVIRRGKRSMISPKPGIEPRDWHWLIAEMRNKSDGFQARVEKKVHVQFGSNFLNKHKRVLVPL